MQKNIVQGLNRVPSFFISIEQAEVFLRTVEVESGDGLSVVVIKKEYRNSSGCHEQRCVGINSVRTIALTML